MNYSVLDAGGLLFAALALAPLLLGFGIAIGAATDLFGFRALGRIEQAGAAIVLALAVEPLVASLTARLAGLDAALGLLIVSAAVGIVIAARAGVRWRPDLIVVGLALAWLGFVLVESIDFDVGGALHQPFTMLDMVKHSATVRAINDTGAPPADPFFFRPLRASYYYFFYTMGALTQRLGAGLIDARAAMGGLIVWTGIAVYALAWLVLRTAGLASGLSRRAPMILLGLMAVSGLDLLLTLRLALASGTWFVNLRTGWLVLVLWVPHHLDAMIASVVGFSAVIAASQPRSPDASGARRAGLVMLGAAGFASALGLSVWVTLAALLTAALWLIVLAAQRRWRMAAILVVAGVLSLVFAAPQIHDLRAARDAAKLPISFAVRAFGPWDGLIRPGPLHTLGGLLLLPVNYLEEFGLPFYGALLFWTQRKHLKLGENALAQVLGLVTIAGLLLGSLVRSDLYNNDLGWRVMLLPQLAAILWTTVVLDILWRGPNGGPAATVRASKPILAGLAVIGLGTTLYTAVALRAYPAMSVSADGRFMNAHPHTDRALRGAYGWMAAHLARTAVVQHNPAPPRVFDFGLYGVNPTGVSDALAGLYGAPQGAVDARLNEVFPIFAVRLTASQVRARAVAAGIDDLVVSADDPIWKARDSWVWSTPALYASPDVRVLAVSALGMVR